MTRRRIHLWLALALPPLALAYDEDPEPEPTTAPFEALDSHRKEVTNFNIETVRGMGFSPDRQRIYAINTHGSRLLYHTDADGVIEEQWTTLNNPVAMDVWERTTDDYSIIVAGGATHAIAEHDPFTGAIVNLMNVPSEPGDLVVTPDGHAWVSCKGEDLVVEIDLATFTEVARYPIPSERPRWLSWHLRDDLPAGYRVFVAPMLSGNNTRQVGVAGGTSEVRALPVDDPTTPVLEGLPDEDLFELFPGTGTSQPVVKGLGSMILEHAKHPDKEELWVLSIVSKNSDITRQTEPALQMDFVDHVMTRVPLGPPGSAPILAPANPTDLDLNAAGGYSTATSCSFPFAIAIDPLTGFAMVASSTNDRLVLLDPNGQRVWQRDLNPGDIPRDILVDRYSDTLTVYLWGSNQLYVLPLSDINAPPLLLDLGLDPTPASIAAGREHWYDAENSLDGRNTCNSCHPGGASDSLGWALTEPPIDRKDVMVTQSLLSIEDTFPYHWRGERQLRDFNRLAFPGLLGGTSLDTTAGGAFDEFKEFVFSLQAPRNPREDLGRVVSDFIAPPGVFPTLGQKHFETEIGLFDEFTCADCHTQPEGTNAGLSFDNDTAAGFPSNANLDVAHLRQLFNKDGGSVSVLNNGDLPRLGWGLSHNGDNFDVFDFLDPGIFQLNPQQRLDVAEFVNQWDQGLAPVAQLAWLMDSSPRLGAALTAFNSYLLPQSNAGWIDVVAFGTLQDAGGNQVFARWLYDPVTATFQANDASITLAGRPAGTALFSDFSSQAGSGTGSNTILGLPPGNGRRFALDPDNDRMTDGAELAWMPSPTDPENPDTDGDGDPDGHEVANPGDPLNAAIGANDTTPPQILGGFPMLLDVSTQTAEYELRFSEPVTYVIRYSRPGGPTLERRRIHPVMEDTIVLQDMQPSSKSGAEVNLPVNAVQSQYTLTMQITDLALNSVNITQIASQPITEEALEPLLEAGNGLLTLPVRMSALTMTTTKSGSTMTATVNAQVQAVHEDLNGGGAFNVSQGQRVLAQVLVNTGAGWSVVSTPQLSSADYFSGFTFGGNPGSAGALGDVLVTGLTNASGNTSSTFSVSGLQTGDQVRFNVVGIVRPDPANSAINAFEAFSVASWILPLTDDDPPGMAAPGLRGAEDTF